MPNVRLNLKYLNNSLDLLMQDIEMLRGEAASPAARKDMAALQKKLAAVRRLMADECPEGQYRTFELTEMPTPTPPPDPFAPVGTTTRNEARKAARRRTRKAR